MFTLTELQTITGCTRKVAFFVVRLNKGIEGFDSMVEACRQCQNPLTHAEFLQVSEICQELGLTVDF